MRDGFAGYPYYRRDGGDVATMIDRRAVCLSIPRLGVSGCEVLKAREGAFVNKDGVTWVGPRQLWPTSQASRGSGVL